MRFGVTADNASTGYSGSSAKVDLPKDCVRWVKSGTDGLTRNKFLRIRPQAWGLAAGGIFRRAQSTQFCHRRSAAENAPRRRKNSLALG